MRFVAVKSVETQGRAVAFRTHQCLVRQRTQLINALRGHLAEFGLVAPKGPACLKVLETALAYETNALPVVPLVGETRSATQRLTFFDNSQFCCRPSFAVTEVATPEGLEPSTWRLEVACSIQLSYGATGGHVPRRGV